MPKATTQQLKFSIGNNLIALMEQNGVSQYKLAKDLGVTEAQVSRIRNAVYSPSLDLLISIADYFSVSTDYLLGR